MSIRATFIAAVAATAFAESAVLAHPPAPAKGEKPEASASKKRPLDRSGRTQRGKASYYAQKFAGRTMADGTPMDPNANIAASRTLPLGTKAKVTNLENGRSAVVEIRDRGPYVEGRTIDLSPKVAEDIGMIEDGVATVDVTPLEIPAADRR